MTTPCIDWRPLTLGERELLKALRFAYVNASAKATRKWRSYRFDAFCALSAYVDHLEAKYRLRTCA